MSMNVAARRAGSDDLATLTELYAALETEMVGLHSMWPRADGLAEPVDTSWKSLLDDDQAEVMVGEIDGVPLGFITGRVEPIIDETASVVAIRLVFVDPEARGVGVGEAMLDCLMEAFRGRSHTLFDAHVLPGHRLAKNFFESGGFSARSIVMHHDDDRVR